MKSMDTRIKSINSKLSRVKETLGEASQLYHKLESIVTSVLWKKEQVVITEHTTRISRSRNAGITDAQMSRIESAFAQNTLTQEKQRIREFRKEYNKANGISAPNRTSYSDYKTFAAKSMELANDIEDALTFFYNHVEGDETKIALEIMRQKGIKSTSQLMEVLRLKKQYEAKKPALNSGSGFNVFTPSRIWSPDSIPGKE